MSRTCRHISEAVHSRARRSGGRERESGRMLRPTRLLALGGIALLGLLYWRPVHTYLSTQHELHQRQAEVASLRTEKRRLQEQIAAVGSGGALVREARRLGLVKPGERLFIVRGIDTWRAAHR